MSIRILFVRPQGECTIDGERVIFVEPLSELLLRLATEASDTSDAGPVECKCTSVRTEGYGAGYNSDGQILAKLSALLQTAILHAPELIAEITAIMALFGAKGPGPSQVTAPTAGFEANGQILAKLAALLQVAIANAPQLIAEITAILALFGAKVPGPTPLANAV